MASLAQFLSGLVSLLKLAVDAWREKNVRDKYDAVKKEGPVAWFKGHFRSGVGVVGNSVHGGGDATNSGADARRDLSKG